MVVQLLQQFQAVSQLPSDDHADLESLYSKQSEPDEDTILAL